MAYRVVEGDRLARLLVEGDAVDEMRRLLDRLERVVGGEHHTLETERRDGAGERVGRAHARRGDGDILPDVFRRVFGELHPVELGAAVEPPEQERQRLTEMAEHQPGAGVALEYAAE